MFNYSNNYVINTAVDAFSGLPKWSAQDEVVDGSGVITKEANFEIKRMGAFKKSAIRSIYRNVASSGTEGKAVFTMKKGAFGNPNGTGSYMLDIYVRLSGQNLDSRFSNAYVLKGTPFTFSIEVDDTDTTATMAQKFAEQINRMGVEYGDMRLTATAQGNDLTVKAGEQDLKYNYIFERANLQQLDDSKDLPVEHVYKTVNSAVVTTPVQPFGDYNWMIRNMILPTTENRAIWGIHEEDQPIVGGQYNQYTITICNRVGVQGSAHVGDVVHAETTHVFYVLNSLATEFEAALQKVGTIVDAK